MAELPLTIQSLVDEVADTVRGYTRGSEEVTSLALPLNATALTFTVTGATAMSRGVVEIDDELVQVKTVDQTTGSCVVEDWGRGVNSSTATTHLAGCRVTVAPLIPRSRIRLTVVATLREIFPDVYPVADTLLDGRPGYVSYTLPDDVYDVLGVYTRMIGPGAEWVPLRRWRVDRAAGAVGLMIYSATSPGSGRVRVQYVRTPPDLNTSEDLAAAGYDASIRDVVVLGATAKLLAFTESSRAELNTVESNSRGALVAGGSAVNLSRQMNQMFMKRVEDERRQLLTRYPPQPHNTTR